MALLVPDEKEGGGKRTVLAAQLMDDKGRGRKEKNGSYRRKGLQGEEKIGSYGRQGARRERKRKMAALIDEKEGGGKRKRLLWPRQRGRGGKRKMALLDGKGPAGAAPGRKRKMAAFSTTWGAWRKR